MSGDEGHLFGLHIITIINFLLAINLGMLFRMLNLWKLESGILFQDEITSQTMTLYKNGVEVDQATGIEGPAESSKTYIGKYASGSYWIGAIDEAGIWDRALSSMEIEQLYNMGNGIIARKANTEDQDLVLEAKGYWKINELESS